MQADTTLEDPATPAPARTGGIPWLHVTNVSASWACQLVAIAGSFIVTPALIFALGEGVYGSWLLVTSFITHLRALDLGTSAATVKYTAGALARGDKPRLIQIHSSSVAMFAMAAAVALLATAAMSIVLPRIFPEALAGQQSVILVLGAAAALDLLVHPQPASLRARSFFFIPDSVEILTYSTFKLGLVLYLAHRGISLWVLCLLILADSVVRNAVNAGAGLWLCDWTRRVSPKAVDRAMVGTLALYGGGSFLINIGELARFQLGSAVIGYFVNSAGITVYSIGMRLIHIAYMSIAAIGGMTFPRFSGLHERGDLQGIERLLRKVNLVTGLVGAYVLANIGVLGLPFLRMWIRKPWVDDAFLVTLIMMPGYFFGLLSTAGEQLVMGSGKLRGLTVLTLTEAGFNLGLGVVLVHFLGIFGVCLGIAVPMAVFRGVVFPFVLRASVGIPVRTYYRTHLKGIVITLVYAVLVLPVLLVPIEGPVAFVVAGLCTTTVFGVLLLVAVPEVRQRIVPMLFRPRA